MFALHEVKIKRNYKDCYRIHPCLSLPEDSCYDPVFGGDLVHLFVSGEKSISTRRLRVVDESLIVFLQQVVSKASTHPCTQTEFYIYADYAEDADPFAYNVELLLTGFSRNHGQWLLKGEYKCLVDNV